ncbi:MAG: FAD-dependent oxidoreductase [Kiritimatiellae bacterium]|nr:FAD-dependent oxidoreductase [Kiritimatiellia bacterium]
MACSVKTCEAAVIGAGPAGLSAALQLAELGVDARVLDEKPAAGGQLFKQIHKFFGSDRHMAGVRGFEIGRRLLARCRELRIPIHLNTAVWGLFPDNTLGATHDRSALTVAARAVIVATGASENALAFPGWTLPGVMGAGAAQTLVNYHRVRPGTRALVVGAGNVGLIVAYQLLQAGIDVAAVVEGMDEVGGYLVHAAKIRRMGVPLLTRRTILRAEGNGCVQRCTIAAVDDAFRPVPGTEQTFDADLVCIAVGLSPAAELCRALGLAMTYVAELGGRVPAHNESLLTSRPGVWVAGDVSGIEEASSAMEEGKLAAISAAAALGRIDAETESRLAGEVNASLAVLRDGPFGELIARRKAELHRRYRQTCSSPVAPTPAVPACSM